LTGCAGPQMRRVCLGQGNHKTLAGHLGQKVGARAAVPEKHEGLGRTGIWTSRKKRTATLSPRERTASLSLRERTASLSLRERRASLSLRERRGPWMLGGRAGLTGYEGLTMRECGRRSTGTGGRGRMNRT
jgi:hypothetical protein